LECGAVLFHDDTSYGLRAPSGINPGWGSLLLFKPLERRHTPGKPIAPGKNQEPPILAPCNPWKIGGSMSPKVGDFKGVCENLEI